MAPSLEVHVPISPTPMFLRQVWALAASLRRFGGEVGREATVTAWVSPELPELPDLHAANPWARELGVDFRWVDQALFERHWYWGTAMARWDAADYRADVVLMLDADVLVCGSLDELVASLLAEPAVAGLPAHMSPYDESRWRELFAVAQLPEPALDCAPSGAGFFPEARDQRMPPYFNLGVIAAPRELMRKLGAGLVGEMERVNAFEESYYRCQLAIPLALARQALPWRALDARWNFPNDRHFEQALPDAAADVRLLHYLRVGDAVSKSRDFNDAAAYAALLARDGLVGTDALLQRRLRELGGCPLDAVAEAPPEALPEAPPAAPWWRRVLRQLTPS